MRVKTGCAHPLAFRPLRQHEIDQRIENLIRAVASGELDGAPTLDPGRPWWIPAKELVRRMRPFMVLN